MKYTTRLTFALGTLLVMATLASAGTGIVTAVDSKGSATVQMEDGTIARGLSITGVKPGDNVECVDKDGKVACMKK